MKISNSLLMVAQELIGSDIREIVSDPTWQALREAFVGTWMESPAANVKKLREYLGENPGYEKLRRVQNYLTGSGFRSGKIKHPEIDQLLSSVTKQLKERKMKYGQEEEWGYESNGYVTLKKLSQYPLWTEEAGFGPLAAFAKSYGFEINELKEFWVDLPADRWVKELPSLAIAKKIRPILVIVHGRMYEEEALGHFDPTTGIAYIEEDIYDTLF